MLMKIEPKPTLEPKCLKYTFVSFDQMQKNDLPISIAVSFMH